MNTSNQDPFCGLSDWLKNKLASAGWRPGASRSKRRGYPLNVNDATKFLSQFDYKNPISDRIHADAWFRTTNLKLTGHTACQIIDQLYGLTALSDPWVISRVPPWQTCQTKIDFTVDEASPEDVRELSAILHTQLIPIAEVRSDAVVLIGETGAMYEMGYVAPGVFLLGDSFESGMTTLLKPLPVRLVTFTEAEDPNRRFTLSRTGDPRVDQNPWILTD